MSILKRVRDISVATLNEKLEQCEDPVRLIDRYLIEQRDQIIQSERLYMQCVNHAHAIRQQYIAAEQYREKREQQALTALKAGEEEVARLALQEKLHYQEKAVQYKDLYEQSKGSIIELESQLNQLKADYQEVAAKRSYYQARMESIRLQQQMNERLSRTNGYTPRMFDRLEERVSYLELESKSLSDVRRMTQEALYSAGKGVQSALENELHKLKAKLEQEGWSGK